VTIRPGGVSGGRGADGAGGGPLDWERLYRDFTGCVTEGDCAELCRAGAGRTPPCCDSDRLALVVFRDELAWARARTQCWRGGRPRSPAERREVAGWADHLALARCVRPRHCDRPNRSLTCRLFPLEPHLAGDGRFLGLTYVYAAARICPLIGREMEVRREFVDQSCAVWQQILAAYPDERACYTQVSQRLRQRLARQGRAVRLFRPGC